MQKISSIAIAAFLMLFISSCTKEELVQDAPTSDSGRVVFSINTGKNMVSTKSDPPPADKEKEQIIWTLGVFIAKPNGELAGGIKRFYEPKDLTGGKLAVSVPVEIMESNDKAYLIANWGNKDLYEAIKTEKELLDLVADTPAEGIASKGIPMACGAISLNFTGGIAAVDANMKRVMSVLCTKVVKEKGVMVSPKDFTFKVHGLSYRKGYFFKDQPNDSGIVKEWAPVSEAMDKEVYLGYFYQSDALRIEVTSKSTRQSRTIEIPAEKAKMRNKKFVLNIHPETAGKGEFNVTVEDWKTINNEVDLDSSLLADFELDADFEAKGIKWDETTRTLDITNATAGSVLKFKTKGVTHVKTSVVPLYNKNASSIGGEESLANILEVGSTIGSNIIPFKVNIPVQTLKVPLDILVSIQNCNFDIERESETITIKSRPDYAGTGIQPVMMKTIDEKLVFWAPINVGATKLPESVPTTENTDITESCGKLFQWGRLSGVTATNNPATIETEKFDGKTDPLGFPKGEGALANMSKWDGKFIANSSKSPNTRGNWFLIDASGTDNPGAIVADAWYQKLWNSRTEEAPVKTSYDPCPVGWRVPTIAEWRALTRLESRTVPGSWSSATNLLSLPGAESGQKLIFPTAGIRGINGRKQGHIGGYWSATPSGGFGSQLWIFAGSGDDAQANIHSYARVCALSVRCIQE